MNAAGPQVIEPFHIHEAAVIANRLESTILAAWYGKIRQSIQLSISDESLMDWLEKCFAAFIAQEECGARPTDRCVFADFASAMQAGGASLNQVIETLYLMQEAVEDCDHSRLPDYLQNYFGRSGTAVSQVKAWARRVAASNIASYIDHNTQQLNRQQDRIASLLRVAQAASSSLALDEVLKVISEEVIRVLDAYGCNAFLFPGRSKYGNYYLIEPLPPSDYKVPDPPDRFTLEALIRKEPVTCYDVMLDSRTDKRTMQYFGLTSALAFPLVFQGKAVAAGFVSMKTYHHFTQDEIDLVMGIANSGAVAVENARLHEMSIQLAIAQERNRLAQEMHDDLAQALAVTKLNLNALLMEDLSSTAKGKVIEAKTLVDDTYVELRDTIFGLRAINDSDTHFLDNFKGYLSTFGIHNNLDIQISVSEEDLKLLSGEAILQVGRIMEEALNNVRKHAQAKQVWIKGGSSDDLVWITVEDDGIGIDPETLRKALQGHFGIPIMMERAESVGGCFKVYQRPSGGTCARLEIPYR